MKRHRVCAILVAACVALMGCERKAEAPPVVQPPPPDPSVALIAKAKYRVTYDFHDPGTAHFREVKLYKRTEGFAVCGQVNGKNLNGGYVGFEPFSWESHGDKAYVQKESDQLTALLITVTCADNTGPQTTTTTGNMAPDTPETPVPIPTGYTRVGHLEYADDKTISPQATAALNQSGNALQENVEVQGEEEATVYPRLWYRAGNAYYAVYTGKHGECHACQGVILFGVYTKSSDGQFHGSLVAMNL